MSNPPPKVEARYSASVRSWRGREADLVDGKQIPNHRDREAGHSPFRGSALLDLRQSIDIALNRGDLPPNLIAALAHCHAVPSASNIWAAREAVPTDDTWQSSFAHLRSELLWHAALRVHKPAVDELLAATLQASSRHNPVSWLQGLALALGLVHAGTNDRAGDELDAIDMETCRDKGQEQIDRIAAMQAEVNLAVESVDAAGDAEVEASPAFKSALAAMKAQQDAAVDADFEEHLTAVLEDRAEIRRDPTLLVIDADPNQKQPGARADIWKAYKSVIGVPLRLVSTAAVPAARTALHARYPHMHVEVDAILATQAALQSVKLSVLLVGEPGSGKTTFARELADLLGVPAMTYSCAGASDGSFGGTSAQWNSARAATPMQLVGRTRTANPLLVVDEIDKIGTSKHNGSLSDTLLTFLEPVSSRVFYDLALEQAVDLSAVSYVATANVLDDVPVALRDRLKVVRIPSPGFEHVGVLSRRIIDDLAQQRGLDRRWLEPLAQDETELVRKAWPGGSLRMLTRIVTTIVDGREQLMGRA